MKEMYGSDFLTCNYVPSSRRMIFFQVPLTLRKFDSIFLPAYGVSIEKIRHQFFRYQRMNYAFKHVLRGGILKLYFRSEIFVRSEV